MSTSIDLNFVAVDFETANESRASVCQVGIARVQHGFVVASDVWDVYPPTGLDYFSPVNVGIHGITADRAAYGLPWSQSLERLLTFCQGLPMVEYGNFDRGVYSQATEVAGLRGPELAWHDASALARRVLKLERHKLPDVCAHLRVPLANHHNALDDSLAAAGVVQIIADRERAWTMEELWPPRSARVDPRFNSKANKARASELPQPNGDADPSHPLFGQRVVLTGEIEGRDRWSVFEAIAAAGGFPQKGVTKQTTVVVAARYASLPADYDPAHGSGKEAKAAEYLAKGQELKFISGGELLRLLAQ